MLILLPILIPILVGLFLLVSSFSKHIRFGKDYCSESKNELKFIHVISVFTLVISSILGVYIALQNGLTCTLFTLFDSISIYFQVDELSLLFVSFVSIVFVLVSIYSCTYMEHEHEEKRFFGFLLIVYGVLIALDFAGNLLTLYFFYEFMSLTSMPFVFHNGSKESIMASLKYLFYSLCGAYLALFGIFVLNQFTTSLTFVPQGTLDMFAVNQNPALVLVAVLCMLIGFGAKAGMFPLHAWLPSAHPVAPSPASALLSSIIVKCGVLAIVRVVFYIVGIDFIQGSYVQTVWMTLSLLTIFMGSLLAFREPVLKKRLAYSSVSQLSYILFGCACLTPQGLSGALLHVICHVFIKCALFLIAGIFIYKCKITYVSDLKGIGKRMPITCWCMTILSLGLIGIPPMSGFISKWYLAQGALSADIGIFRYLGVVVLLVSALLTAGYLLDICLQGFLPGQDVEVKDYKEANFKMLLPIIIFAGFTILIGLFPNSLLEFINGIVSQLF